MRRRILCALAGGGLAGPAAAQQAQPLNISPVAGPAMPGTVVGTGIARPVGNQVPKAAPPAGRPVGTRPGAATAPPGGLDPNSPRPAGTPIDLANVVAPYPGMPKPAPTFWDKLEARWFGWLTGPAQPVAPPPNWTPGLGRRNRERREARERMGFRD